MIFKYGFAHTGFAETHETTVKLSPVGWDPGDLDVADVADARQGIVNRVNWVINVNSAIVLNRRVNRVKNSPPPRLETLPPAPSIRGASVVQILATIENSHRQSL